MSIDYAEIARLAKKGRVAERRGKAIANIVAALISDTISAFLKGFLLMIAVGIIHAHWIPQLPTIGYWWAVLVMAVLPSFGGSTKKADD